MTSRAILNGWPLAPGQAVVAPAPTPSAVIRILPINALEAYVIWPHPVLGAIGMHLGRGNLADTSTPASSIGGPEFGGWRVFGFRVLPSVAATLASTVEIIQDGIGASEYAYSTAGLFGGIYHAFRTGSFVENVPDLTTERMVASFTMSHDSVALWPGGQSVSTTQTISIDPVAGTLQTVTATNSGATLNIAYLDMLMVNDGYIRARVDAGAYIDISGTGDLDIANGMSVTFRNPTTGTTVTQTDDAASKPQYDKRFIARRSGDRKLYPRLTSSAAFGSATVTRTISFGKTTPDPTVTLSGDVTQAEGQSGTTVFTWTVTRSATSGAVNVPWTFSAGTTSADDFVGGVYPTGGTVALADGQASGTFVVNVAGDATVENSEAFGVSITVPLGYGPGVRTSAAGGITNDDAGVVYVWDGVANGPTGYQDPTAGGYSPGWRTYDSTAKQLVFTRQQSSSPTQHRTLFPLPSGLIVDALYSVTFTAQITGASASAGVSLGISVLPDSGGGQQSTANMSAAIAGGSTPYTFTARAGQNYLVINMANTNGAATDNVFRLSRIGQVTPA